MGEDAAVTQNEGGCGGEWNVTVILEPRFMGDLRSEEKPSQFVLRLVAKLAAHVARRCERELQSVHILVGHGDIEKRQHEAFAGSERHLGYGEDIEVLLFFSLGRVAGRVGCGGGRALRKISGACDLLSHDGVAEVVGQMTREAAGGVALKELG